MNAIRGKHGGQAGVTLTELLVVLLIIALLSTVAVPVYLSRIREAQIRTAQLEVRELARAMDMCAAIHGFYVPLQMLDDLPTDQGTRNQLTDDIQNELNANPFVVNVNIPILDAAANQTRLSSANADVTNLRTQWKGPFINFNRFFKGFDTGRNRMKSSTLDSTQTEVSLDFPLDPWSQPYRVFSPLGYTGNLAAFDTNSPSAQPSAWNADTFNLFLNQVGGPSDTNPYDRWAIVSYGPNQRPDQLNQPESNDDIVHFFGFLANETVFAP